jgi:polyhydroxyalkanoate synthesis regulator phasin
MQTCVCVCAQEQVRVLTAEVAALRQQVAELAERSQQDTSNEVCGVYRVY